MLQSEKMITMFVNRTVRVGNILEGTGLWNVNPWNLTL